MKLVLFCMLLMITAACTKDGLIPGDSSQLNGDKSLLKSGHCGEVFIVLPNGTDDSENLLRAFADAKLAGRGSVVQLVEGDYNIGLLEIRDFKGYFRGAGKGRTKIQNLDNMPPSLPYYENNMMEGLMLFIGGDVNISRMTLTTTNGPVCPDDPYYGFLPILIGFSDYSAMYLPDKRFIRAVVEDVDIIGGSFNGINNAFGTDHNVGMAFYAGPDINTYSANNPFGSVDVTIKHCSFEHVGVALDTWGLDEKSTVNFDDNNVKNSFYNIFMGGSLGLKAFIRNNKLFDAPLGTYIDDSDYGLLPIQSFSKRTQYTISGNYCESHTGSINLYLHDGRRIIYPDEGLPQLFDIHNNTFDTQDDCIAIQSLNGVGSKIWNNKFIGTGAMGVMIDGDADSKTFTEQIKLFGNNFFSATYTNANVYLGPFSRNCTVIGVSTDKVDNEGVNNSIIGTKVHKQGIHFGQFDHYRLRQMHENLMRRGKH